MGLKEEYDTFYARAKSVEPFGVKSSLGIVAAMVEYWYKDGTILEVGCGLGQLYILLSDKVKENYRGMDISKVAIDRCRRELRVGSDIFSCGDIETWSGSGYAFIVVADVLPLLGPVIPQLLFKKLKQNGILLMSSWYDNNVHTGHLAPLFWQQLGGRLLFQGELLHENNFSSSYTIVRRIEI